MVDQEMGEAQAEPEGLAGRQERRKRGSRRSERDVDNAIAATNAQIPGMTGQRDRNFASAMVQGSAEFSDPNLEVPEVHHGHEQPFEVRIQENQEKSKI